MLRVRGRPPAVGALQHSRSVRFEAPYSPSVILAALADAPQLRSVHLPLPPPAEAPRVGAALRQLKELNTLVVHPYAPPPPFPVQFLEALEGHETISTLSLIGCGLQGADTARALNAILTKCKAFDSLWIGRNPLGAEAASVLASGAPSWPRLQHLSLRSCAIPDRPALALAYAAPQHWPHLVQLDLRSNPFSPQCISALLTLRSRHSTLKQKILFDLLPPSASSPSTSSPPTLNEKPLS